MLLQEKIIYSDMGHYKVKKDFETRVYVNQRYTTPIQVYLKPKGSVCKRHNKKQGFT